MSSPDQGQTRPTPQWRIDLDADYVVWLLMGEAIETLLATQTRYEVRDD